MIDCCRRGAASPICKMRAFGLREHLGAAHSTREKGETVPYPISSPEGEMSGRTEEEPQGTRQADIAPGLRLSRHPFQTTNWGYQ